MGKATSGQIMSLPKGGGAIQGMGEKFSLICTPAPVISTSRSRCQPGATGSSPGSNQS
jgi:hypothetical protein